MQDTSPDQALIKSPHGQGVWPAMWLSPALPVATNAAEDVGQMLARLDASMRAFTRAFLLMERRVDSARRRRIDRQLAIRERRAIRSAKHYRRRSSAVPR